MAHKLRVVIAHNCIPFPHSSSSFPDRFCTVLVLLSTLVFHRIAYLHQAAVHATPCLSCTLSTRRLVGHYHSFSLIMRDDNALPLLTFEPGTLPPIRGHPADDFDSDDERLGTPRRWYHYLPLSCESHRVHLPIFFFPLLTSPRSQVAVLLLLAPHPSILYVLLNYHYLTLHAPYYFIAHLLVIYTLSFLAFSSLIACVARDPGPIPEAKVEEVAHDVGGDMSLEDALLSAPPSDDYTQPGKWCRICWRPKPERAHHCSQCGRCILKMGACVPPCIPHVLQLFPTTGSRYVPDHHCPWMGAKCIVRRPYDS